MTTSTTTLKPATFAPQTTFAVGTNPASVSVADVNNDGNADVVTANVNSNNVSVLLGKGDGSFKAKVTFTVGTKPSSVSIMDVNGDGNADLVTTNMESNNISVLIGDGQGNFAPQTTFAVGAYPYSVSGSDVNGDGNEDLITANARNNNISVLMGDENGNFEVQKNFTVGTTPASVNVVDVNNDGNVDVVTADSGSNNVSMLIGDGKGDFTAKTSIVVGNSPYAPIFKDFNNDGKLDLATANSDDNSFSIVLGNGNGGFAIQTTFAVSNTEVRSIDANDLNGDGDLDVVLVGRDGKNVMVFLGDGTGKFGLENTLAISSGSFSIKIADFNNDGKPDLVTANRDSNNVSILLNTTEGTFTAPSNPVISATPTYSLTVQPNANENGNSAFVLTTQNVAVGTEIPFDLSGTISDADVLGGLSTHSFVIEDDGTATLPIKYIEDQKTEGDEILTVTLHDKPAISAIVTVKDTSIAPLPPVNHAPTGNVMILGKAIEGEKLSIQNTLKDADGLSTFSYQWLQNGKAISGATQKDYVLQASDIGKTIKVKVSYTDKIGTFESKTSDATSFVELQKVISEAPSNPNPSPSGFDGIHDAGSSASKKIKGGEKSDWFEGQAGNDTLIGMAGNDSLDGGTGNDSLDAGNGNDTLLGGEGNDTLLGGSDNDNMNGGAGNDSFDGGAGNDMLIGGTGNDTMIGGNGNDYYVVDNAKDLVKETESNAKIGGNDTIERGINIDKKVLLETNVENLILTGLEDLNGVGNSANNHLTGNQANNFLDGKTGNDTLIGGEGDDTLDGGSGKDQLEGGKGNDVYFMNNDGDMINDNGDQTDQDEIISTVDYDLSQSPDIEILTLSSEKAINGTGNESDNVLREEEKGKFANNFNGGKGNDSIISEGGDDTLIGGDGNDTLDGGTGNDTAIFDGAFDDYQFSRNIDGEFVDQITVENINAADAERYGEIDILDNIELIQFSDGDIKNIRTDTIDVMVTNSNALLVLTGVMN